jgi:hypothetical protein
VRLFRLGWVIALLAVAGVMAPAQAERRISPYIEVQQVLDADFNNGGDVLTYTSIAAGVDAEIRNRRVEVGLSYRYERRIAYEDNLGDEDIHSGLARARAQITPALSIEGGAIATRARGDIRGGAPTFLTGDNNNITQVYGFYGGPTLSTQAGPLEIGASYKFGYVKVEDNDDIVLAPGQPRLDSYDSSTSHQFDASVGMKSGPLPFGWTVSAGYMREDASQLDQRFTGAYVRGDITVPVSPTVALTAGAGYEDIKATERAPLLNPDGTPVISGNGRFVTDPNSPRLLAYQTDGLIYDAGVIWRPNRRTTLQVRAGKRYGSTAVTGSLDLQLSRYSGLRVGIYHGIDSFGRSLTRSLAGLPTSFNVSRNPLTGDFNRCVFGPNPGTGGCLDDTLQSISTSNFRSRGVNILYSAARGPWSFGLGAGYAQRRYLAPTGIFFTVEGVTDESWMLQADLGRQLTASSGIDLAAFADWYESGIAGGTNVQSAGATAAYYRSFGDRLRGQAAIGIQGYDQDGFDTRISGQMLLGMRYQF